ncbi:hypothetical protein SKAU_G00227300 [Synaphobranchus kaupii]|uniref:Uncharacterized protein n=1 Tax=Synaphobranchus kaupii TaxID=118154 RepID=A0A9Q1F5C3_SYNKA|nr:hypothetical protein SKAU_G00227300 [Synaphobranchus kaupii]
MKSPRRPLSRATLGLSMKTSAAYSVSTALDWEGGRLAANGVERLRLQHRCAAEAVQTAAMTNSRKDKEYQGNSNISFGKNPPDLVTLGRTSSGGTKSSLHPAGSLLPDIDHRVTRIHLPHRWQQRQKKKTEGSTVISCLPLTDHKCFYRVLYSSPVLTSLL